MNPLTQADLVATLMERFSAPAHPDRSVAARALLTVVADAALIELSGYRDPSDPDQVMRFVAAAMRGIPQHIRESAGRRTALDVGHAATFLAHGLAHNRDIDDVLAALDLASSAAEQLTMLAPATSRDEPGHVLPISAAIGIAFLSGSDATQLSDAIGIASSMTVATRAPDRSGPADGRLVAMCCANGTLAAYLANDGFTASPRGIEGKRGWRASLGGGAKSAEPGAQPSDAEFVLLDAAQTDPASADQRGIRQLFSDLARFFEEGVDA